MKRLFALLITALMIIFCTACAPDTQNPTDTQHTDDTHTHTHSHTEAPQTTETESVNEPTSAQTTYEENEDTTNTESDSPQQNNETKLSKGTISKNTYKSTTTGLKFTKPADWTFLSDEELALKIGVDTMELEDYAFATTAERVPAVYDMWVTSPEKNINISIAYENMHVTASVAMTTDEYMEMLEGAFANTKGTTLVQKSTVNLSNRMYQKAVFTTETSGTSTQSVYYLRAMGKFMNIVLVTSPSSTELPDIEKMFN